MKSKGQTLVLFVILIPLIIMFAAYIVDTGLMYSKSEKLKSVTKDVIRENYLTQDLDKVKLMYEKNGFDLDKLEVEFGSEMKVKAEDEVDSIFGKILGFNSYKIKVDLVGYKNGEKIEFRE